MVVGFYTPLDIRNAIHWAMGRYENKIKNKKQKRKLQRRYGTVATLTNGTLHYTAKSRTFVSKSVWLIFTAFEVSTAGLSRPKAGSTEPQVPSEGLTLSKVGSTARWKTLSETKKRKRKILKAIVILYQSLEALHPFRDGNGRTNNLVLQKALIDNGFRPVKMDFYLMDVRTTKKAVKLLKRALK